MITLDGKRIRDAEAHSYIALYKPRNVISSVDDPEGRPTVRELIPEVTRLYPVGRLDWDSEGLVLMTNDGELANRLTHPRYGHTKEYRVLVARRPDGAQLDIWRRGVVLEDGYRSAPAEVRIESTSGRGAWLRVIMGEGRKRQIREIAGSLGLPVVRIVRKYNPCAAAPPQAAPTAEKGSTYSWRTASMPPSSPPGAGRGRTPSG